MKRLIRASEDAPKKMYNAYMLKYLKMLDTKLQENDMFGELDIFGGAVMCLALNARQSTADIDAIFSPKSDMRELIHQIAEENDLPEDWLNDGVKGFVSPVGEYFRYGEDMFQNLTVFMTDPEYLLVMKCLSCRTVESSDASDIKFLVNYLHLETVDDVENVIMKYYPRNRFQPKTHYLLIELLEEHDS